MKLEDASAYVDNCINGEPAACSCGCPFHMDIRGFLEKAAKGKWTQAYKALRGAVVFPTVAAALCDRPCRSQCLRTQTGDEAIALGDVEAAVIKYAKNRAPEGYVIPPKAQRIAVVGAGAAGLSAALALGQKKYGVTVFDRAEGWGGHLRLHERFAEFDADFALQFSNVNVEFKFNHEITSLDELSGYDVVYVATGKGGDSFGLLEGWNKELLTTDNPKVFMGGEVTGATLMEGIAQGSVASMTIEAYIQTGKASKTPDAAGKSSCGRHLDYSGAEKAPLVPMASPDGYTEDEARSEAGRCLQCDCAKCMDACEMLKFYRKKPRKLGQEVYSDMGVNPPYSSHTLVRETFSCNICGHCKEICPTNVDVGALLQFSREERLKKGDTPAAFHDYWLREFDFYRTEGFFAAPPKGKATCEYAFFPGCQLTASSSERVLKAFEYLGSRYETGVVLGCCGAPAYWAGDGKRLSDNAEQLKAVWEALGKPTFVFACAYCENVFTQFLPEIQRVSLYELMARDDTLQPTRPFDSAVVFDPCMARDDEGMQKGVRELIGRAGTRLEELAEPFRCCGNGGHIQLANRELYDEITLNRAEASALPYIVYCANCHAIFKQRGKGSVHILDAAFNLDTSRPVPTLKEKKDNSLEVKKTLMKNLTGQDFTPATNDWDGLTLIIAPDLQDELDRKLITEVDLKEAIWLAEQSGDMFYNDEDDVVQCRMVKSVLTYWVQYRETAAKTYEILSAYTHRMRFSDND